MSEQKLLKRAQSIESKVRHKQTLTSHSRAAPVENHPRKTRICDAISQIMLTSNYFQSKVKMSHFHFITDVKIWMNVSLVCLVSLILMRPSRFKSCKPAVVCGIQFLFGKHLSRTIKSLEMHARLNKCHIVFETCIQQWQCDRHGMDKKPFFHLLYSI